MTLGTFGEKLELRCEIEIDAAPTLVWKTLVDFPSYRLWNPYIVQISGQLTAGGLVRSIVCPPEHRELKVVRRIETLFPETELRWKGYYGFGILLRGEQYFRLSEVAPDRTRLTVGENLYGPYVTGNSKTVLAITRGLALMNQAIKRRLECSARSHAKTRDSS